MAGKVPSEEYTGVEVTYNPPDPWSGLASMGHEVNSLCGPGAASNPHVRQLASEVSKSFLISAKMRYRLSNLNQQSSEMYNGYFCKLRKNGDIVFGNDAISSVTGEPYATHWEYGHWNLFKRQQMAPVPIMRPAIQTAMKRYYKTAQDDVRDAYFRGASNLVYVSRASLQATQRYRENNKGYSRHPSKRYEIHETYDIFGESHFSGRETFK